MTTTKSTRIKNLHEGLAYNRNFSKEVVADNVNLLHRLRMLEEENGKLKEEKELWKSRVSTLESEQLRKDSELKEKDRLLTGLQEEVQDLKKTLQFHQDEAEPAHAIKMLFQERFVNLADALDKKHTECKNLRERFLTLADALERTYVESENLKEEISQKDEELTHLTTLMETAQAEREKAVATVQEQEAAAKDALQKTHKETVEQLTKELTNTRLNLKKSFMKWEDRWADREKDFASQVSALHEEHKKELMLLKTEKDKAATMYESDKAALVKKNVESLAELTKMETLIHNMEADGKIKSEGLEQQLQREIRVKEETVQQKEELLKRFKQAEGSWTVKEEKWMESKRKTELDVGVLIDRIIKLNDLASKSDWEKAKLKRAEEKEQRKAAKEREKERKERKERRT